VIESRQIQPSIMKMPVGSGEQIIEVVICEGVAAPSILSTTLLYAIAAEQIEGRSVFDIGCGTGYVGLSLLVRGAASLCASDISDKAVDNATASAAANGLQQRSDFRVGALFEPFAGMAGFDLILSNPPQTPSAMVASMGDRPATAIDGGPCGCDLLLGVLESACLHLAAEASLYVPCSSLAHPAEVLSRARELFVAVDVVAQHRVPFDNWRLQHLPFLCAQRERGMAALSYTGGHPYWHVAVLRCQQPRQLQ
jgi:methylase of polypeptide subunit release factors